VEPRSDGSLALESLRSSKGAEAEGESQEEVGWRDAKGEEGEGRGLGQER
jgi:hypothetical protein